MPLTLKLNPGRSLTMLLVPLLLASCNLSLSKRGCMDKGAENYEPKAKKDCSCCFFNGRILAWIYYQDESRYAGVKKLNFYADGELVKTYSGAGDLVEYSTDPGGYAPYATFSYREENVVAINIGGQKSKAVHLVVSDENNNSYWDGTISLKAGEVVSLQLR